jgi:hypothetical protein
MSCNCKTSEDQYSIGPEVNLTKKITNYTLRSIVFLFSLILLPIIIAAAIWFMFRTLVLNKDVNITEILTILANKLSSNKDDDYDDDYDDDDDEYELIDVEHITNEIK